MAVGDVVSRAVQHKILGRVGDYSEEEFIALLEAVDNLGPMSMLVLQLRFLMLRLRLTVMAP